MSNKLAIVFCVHHKPWLIMSTLISVLAQDYRDKDLIFLYQNGNGSCPKKDTYNEYRKLSAEYGVNIQLSDYDPRVKEVCRIKNGNITNLEFENDHSLDSGAWYKFIKTGLWRKYDYVFFLGEGALLTFNTTLTDSLNFAKKQGIHFITGSQEKRSMPKERFLNYNVTVDSADKMGIYHDQMIRETFNIFCRDKAFKNIFDSWLSDFELTTENHVPDMRGALGNLIHRKEYIYVNAVKKELDDVVKFRQEGNVKFHKENDPQWFGCCCNHLVTRDFLERFSRKLEQYNMCEAIELPFAGTTLEVIWGLIPLWLGFDKWFFNGIHRVRKNFLTYRREDNPEGMSRYLNRYYARKIKTTYKGDFIKIKKLNSSLRYMKEILNSYYF